MKTKFSRVLAVHKRGLRELHKVSPKLFPVMTLSAVVSAVIPYVTVYFSAKILTELALLRRTDVLWQWVVAGVAAMGFLGIIHAFLQRRYETLVSDVCGRKEILFCRSTSA